jgi:PAS domain S-box-containing protein
MPPRDDPPGGERGVADARQARVLLSVLEDLNAERARLRTEIEQRRRAEQRFRSMIEAAPNAILMTDALGEIVLSNAEAENVFGYEAGELLGQPIERLVPEGSRSSHPKLREGFFQRPEPRRMGSGRNLFGVRKDGTEFPVEIGLNPVETDEGLFVLSAVVDVTERKALEAAQHRLNEALEERVRERTRELELARDAAQDANRAKSAFLANMSHEIRTPLNAVIGLTELVLDSQLSDEHRDHLTTVMSSAEALLAVLNDILDFSKIEARKLDLEQVPFRLHDVVADTLRPLAMRAAHKGIELISFIAPQAPAVLSGDPGRLRQVLSNLVQNAIKFTERGEVVVRVDAEPVGDQAQVYFSVKDTGIGIAPADLDRLFAPFEQADTSTTRRFGGTGLGLAISRQLVDLMGGQIGAESTPGEGSIFHFTARFGVLESPAAIDATSPLPLAGARILIVDDNETNRDTLEQVVRAKGMRPVLAGSAGEGFARLEHGLADADPIRLLLTDLHMPEVDGLALAERIRSDSRFDELAIVLLTSAGQAGDLARCNELRVSERVVKPIHQSELYAVMMRTLGFEVPPAPSDPRSEAGQSEDVLPVPPLRILLVDDSQANRKVALALLEGHGHRITEAENGEDALARLASDSFDLVLMDVQMPVMDGLEAVAAIRAREAGTGRHVPIVAMTAHALRGDREKCVTAGMDEYVSKPVRRRDLLDALARAVDQGRSA